MWYRNKDQKYIFRKKNENIFFFKRKYYFIINRSFLKKKTSKKVKNNVKINKIRRYMDTRYSDVIDV